jgi:hypothetical protein
MSCPLHRHRSASGVVTRYLLTLSVSASDFCSQRRGGLQRCGAFSSTRPMLLGHPLGDGQPDSPLNSSRTGPLCSEVQSVSFFAAANGQAVCRVRFVKTTRAGGSGPRAHALARRVRMLRGLERCRTRRESSRFRLFSANKPAGSSADHPNPQPGRPWLLPEPGLGVAMGAQYRRRPTPETAGPTRWRFRMIEGARVSYAPNTVYRYNGGRLR